MNIALDIDGTINAAPSYFRSLSKSVGKSDRVLVLSHRPAFLYDVTIEELADYGVEYDLLLLIGRDHTKAEICKMLDIDIIIDDSYECVTDLPITTMAFLPVVHGQEVELMRWRL